MSKPSRVEDAIAEALKDINNHKATYIIRFNYGYLEIEEIHEEHHYYGHDDHNDNQPTLFTYNKEEKK